MSTATLSQISCFSSLNRERKLLFFKSAQISSTPRRRPFKFSGCVHFDGSDTQTPSSKTETNIKSGGNASKLHVEEAVKSNAASDERVSEEPEPNETAPEQNIVASQKKTAKIHDFCLGIPFGGLIVSGGVVGSLFSRNLSTLGTGVLFGGGVLALSTFSLKVWRQGKSSFPLILGQAALAVVLLWKNLQTYFLTKKVFPTGFYAAISAAMLCFYSYVLAAGGNPPPKKSKVAPTPAT